MTRHTSYRKELILDERHWTIEDYKQRILTKRWRQLLMNNDDQVIYLGRVYNLKAKSLGAGVYEISKEIKND